MNNVRQVKLKLRITRTRKKMLTQTKRYKTEKEESPKTRQLSGLLNIISNNLSVATDIVGHSYKIESIHELEMISSTLRKLSKELLLSKSNEELLDRISLIKHKTLALIVNAVDELGRVYLNRNTLKRDLENIIVSRRLLRDTQRGIVTIQD